MFVNKARNIVKVIGPTSIYTEYLPGEQTFDYNLRLADLLKRIGKHFGFDLTPSREVVEAFSTAINDKNKKAA